MPAALALFQACQQGGMMNASNEETFTLQLQALIDWYQRIAPDNLGEIARFYAEDADFVDPFNDVRGVAAIENIFRHMFIQVEAPRFVVNERFISGTNVVLGWNFLFRSGKREMSIEGLSRLIFNAEGLVVEHRDYWDASSQLYVHLPFVGGIFRFLVRRLSAS
jgi:steroid Delta-isomerase